MIETVVIGVLVILYTSLVYIFTYRLGHREGMDTSAEQQYVKGYRKGYREGLEVGRIESDAHADWQNGTL